MSSFLIGGGQFGGPGFPFSFLLWFTGEREV